MYRRQRKARRCDHGPYNRYPGHMPTRLAERRRLDQGTTVCEAGNVHRDANRESGTLDSCHSGSLGDMQSDVGCNSDSQR